MLGLINAVTATFGAIDRYVKQGLVMANRFLTPPKLTFPANGSAEFDGASDYIQLNTPFSYTNHTIAAWCYVENDATVKTIFDNRASGTGGIFLHATTGETLYYEVDASSLLSTSSFANEWVYVVGTYDGSTQNLYINGSLDGTKSVAKTVSTSTNALIGARSHSGLANYYNGNLANVAIWNRALSSDEINSVMWKGYDALATSEKNGLQAWYSLEESELLSGDSTATLEKYAEVNGLTFEGKQCVQDALNGLPDITDARLHSANYDIRVSADGGNVESLSCVETELNAIL